VPTSGLPGSPTPNARLHVDEAEVVLVVETRGPAHCEEVIGALRSAGYTLAFG
jgi:threonine dehydratase